MQDKKHFSGSIVIGDPSYFVNSDEDWEKCEYGENMSALGFTDFLRIEFPDDPQVVKDEATGEIIGGICQDSCVIVVVYKSELEAYNPDYEKAFGSEDNWTLVEEFDGEVSVDKVPYEDDEFDTIIDGTGNKSFKSCYEEDENEVVPNVALQDELSKIIGMKLNGLGT